MRNLETDYLIIGAGASGMAIADELLALSEADMVLVDRRHRPGGHWLDAYPFVRLHQPSANYGVGSRRLGHDRIDTHGINAGFYERASAAEICDYYGRVLDETLLPSGRVAFHGLTEYRGETPEGHLLVSLLTGEETTVRVRRRLVDATYVESSIPSRHTPGFTVDEGVKLVPPNDLVELGEAPAGFTVIGAGKTAMDTCCWLIEAGVDPDRIEWVRTRDPLMFSRGYMQPLDLVANYMEMEAHWIEASAQAEDGPHFGRILEEAGVMVRIDPATEPVAYRGAIISLAEIEMLRSIERVVRSGRVKRLSSSAMETDGGSVACDPGRVFVDCTAQGVRPTVPQPVFAPGRITMQLVTIGILPYSAATIGACEALAEGDDERNRLCPPLAFDGTIHSVLAQAFTGIAGASARLSNPDVARWDAACRLNPARAALDQTDDPRIQAALSRMMTSVGPAMRNLASRMVAA